MESPWIAIVSTEPPGKGTQLNILNESKEGSFMDVLEQTVRLPKAFTVDREKILDTLFKSAVFLVLFLCFTSVVAVLGFLFNIPIGFLHFPLALLASAGVTLLLAKLEKKGDLRQASIPIALGGVLILAMTPLYTFFRVDFFHDCLWYHLPAIYSLLDGWNPLREMFTDNAALNVWINHFPKASWYYSATLSAFFGNTTFGKSYHMVGALALILTLFSIFCRKGSGKNLVLRVLTCLALGLNPVFLTQFPTHYNDSLVGSLLLCLLVTLLAIDMQIFSAKNPFVFAMISLCIALCINLKYSGLLFAGAFCILFALKWIYQCIKSEQPKRIFEIAFPGLAGLALALFMGINPYITNLLRGLNILFPLFGYHPGIHDRAVMVEHPPFVGVGHFEKLFFSIFSETGWKPALKAPWSFEHLSNEAHIILHDTPLGGFGPFFQLLLWVSLIYLVLRIISRRSPDTSRFLYLIGSIVLVLLVVPWTWWARYYPLLWAVPFLVVLMGLMDSQETPYEKVLPDATMIVAYINILIVCLGFYGLSYLDWNQQFLSILNSRPSNQCEVWCSQPKFLFGVHRILNSNGIKVRFVKHLPEYEYTWNTVHLKFVLK